LEISARLIDAKSGKILYQGRIVYGFSVATDEDAVLGARREYGSGSGIALRYRRIRR